MTQSEIHALINLIDDPDEAIFETIREKIISLGIEVIPTLEAVWETSSFGNLFQHRIEDVIHRIQYDSIYNQLHTWAASGGNDLLEGTLMVARYQYPDLDITEVKEKILRVRQDIWLEINESLTALEIIKVFNHIILTQHGFSGNKQNYHAPQNSYLNNVMESKRGNPLSLAILYIILADSLDVPIFGVNLPNHFLLAYVDQTNFLHLFESMVGENQGNASGVLFYVNPFSAGTILHKSEIDQYLKHLKLDPHPVFYNPCTNIDIVTRLIHNLIQSYDRLGYPEKVAELRGLLRSLEPAALPPHYDE